MYSENVGQDHLSTYSACANAWALPRGVILVITLIVQNCKITIPKTSCYIFPDKISGILPSDKYTWDSSKKTALWLWGCLEEFEAKYSPKARLVLSLLYHKRISEPEGTSKKETCLLRWILHSHCGHLQVITHHYMSWSKFNHTYSFICQSSLQRKEMLIQNLNLHLFSHCLETQIWTGAELYTNNSCGKLFSHSDHFLSLREAWILMLCCCVPHYWLDKRRESDKLLSFYCFLVDQQMKRWWIVDICLYCKVKQHLWLVIS